MRHRQTWLADPPPGNPHQKIYFRARLDGQISDLSRPNLRPARRRTIWEGHHVAREVRTSDLAYVVKYNGDFRKNYGLLIGACLYVLS